MTRFRTIATAALLVIAGTASASAQGYGYGAGYRPIPNEIDVRQARQAERIERGYRDGSLTPREASALMEEQRRIAATERRAKADGYVDPYERARLRNMQENASRNIAMERRDFEGRNAALDRPWWRRWMW